MPGRLKQGVILALIAAAYYLAGRLGLTLAFVNASATAVWPPTGIALAAFLGFGAGVWPGVLLGAFLVNAATTGTAATSLGIAVGNTLEGLLGSYLVNRFAGGARFCERPQDVFKFTLLAALLSPAVSASFGVTSLALGGFASWSSYGPIWSTWWLGDAVGALLVAPPLLLWSADPRLRWTRRQTVEAGFLLLALLLVGRIAFHGLLPFLPRTAPLSFLCLPLGVWVAFRFGPREAVTATLLLSGIALWGTLNGFGVFAGVPSTHASLLLLQAFMGVVAVTFLGVATVVTQRKKSEDRFRGAVEAAPNAMILVGRDGKIALANSQTETLFGYARRELIGQTIELLVPPRFRGGHSGHRTGFFADPRTRAMGAGRDLFGLRKDGAEIPVEIGLNPIETPEGVFVLAAIIDITERKRAEDQIKSSLREKEILLKEIHHRVKNNLQVITSLLNLQARHVKDPEALTMFRDSADRIKSMALLHEKLYKSGDLARVDVADYVRQLTASLFQSYRVNPNVTLTIEADPVFLGVDTAVACGLILNELVSNALKHAFPDRRAGEVRVTLRADGGDAYLLVVRDDGAGLPPGVDFHRPRSLGLQLVNSLAEQLGGTLETGAAAGTAVTLRFTGLKHEARLSAAREKSPGRTA